MAKFCSLYSSSSGNCTYIGSSSAGILIDIGVSAKRAEAALDAIDVDPRAVKAIFITHEHSDHIQGVRVFASRYGIPVYATRGTITGMFDAGAVNEKVDVRELEGETEAAGMLITPFATSHDARQSCGYTVVTADGKKTAVCTDTGIITDGILDAICGSELILLESNHDEGMLRLGPYPYHLKRRILSDMGHLSNLVCAETAVRLVSSGTTRLYLGHLSRENNLPPLALETTRSALKIAGAEEFSDYLLALAEPDNPVLTTF